MKRLFLVLALALIGVMAFAAGTATLSLTGSVPASTNITVTPQAGVFPMDLSVTAANTLIAVVNEQSNDHLGYKVSVASANLAGAGTQPFFKDAVSGDTLNYSLLYNGSAVVFAAGASQITSVAAKTGSGGVNKNLNISFTGDPSLSASAGGYADTLTFTITGN